MHCSGGGRNLNAWIGEPVPRRSDTTVSVQYPEVGRHDPRSADVHPRGLKVEYGQGSGPVGQGLSHISHTTTVGLAPAIPAAPSPAHRRLAPMNAQSPYASALAAIPQRQAQISVLGAVTQYWEYGPADADTVLLFVHGFRGDHHGLEPVVAHLGGNVRIIAPDLPGFGTSEVLPEREHDLQAFVDWLIAFREQVVPGGPTTFAVLGHSFGSIVVSAAAAAGLRTPRVILVNPIAAPALEGPRGLLTRLAVFYYWVGSKLPQRLGFWALRWRLVTRIMSVTMAKTKDKSLRRWIHQEHDRYFGGFADRDSLLQAFKTSVSHNVAEAAAAIPQPTLLIAAAQDDITPVAAQHDLQQRFPDATLVVIEGVGHLIHYETPMQAAEAIRAFLPSPDRTV